MHDGEPAAAVMRVDLTRGSITRDPVPQDWLERFIGGKGLAARYLYDAVPAGADPLGEDNALCLFRGPLSGYLPGSTKYVAVTQSPLTGIFVDSYSGGDFATAFVAALEDAMGVVITGRADAPRELVIESGEASLRPAGDRWGMDTRDLAAATDGAVAGIGPAGERGVRFATIAADGGAHHAGRGGTGAVMGAKRLKAVVARGDLPDRPALAALRERYAARFDAHPKGHMHRSSGTMETVDAADAVGVLPTRGWTESSFEASAALGIEAVREAATDREGDGSIPGDFRVDEVDVPRGGLGIALGTNLGIGSFEAVLDLGRLCDSAGMDVIEAGNAVAWAMLASDRGLIDRRFAFGDAGDARRLLTEIAERSTPLGDRLAEGIDAAAAAYGGDELVPTVNRMAAASYDPRPAPSMALAFATSDRGACHRRSTPVFDEVVGADWDDTMRVEAVRTDQDLRSLLWCYVIDDVTAPAFDEDVGQAYFDALGWDLEEGELRAVGERVWTLTRLFNVRAGLSAADDDLPAAFTRPLEGGQSIDPDAFERLRRRYYAAREWGPDGCPSRDLVERLGLADVVDEETPLAVEAARER